ncbi:hypothetical protein [Halosimplex pelagicum]|uniref:Uncharacterized protein n=1 Tax=Halosimplex pelagicum TaxID=869886 RepID=A0A7D5TBG6_9EURY|nr:hypothetical protein [Halosimplex pelagicum]QLH82253.1 hypothetical protein HZS54_11810 [Halosimplex pelagicum]
MSEEDPNGIEVTEDRPGEEGEGIDVEDALAEISEMSCESPSNLAEYQDQFANGLPEGFEPEVVDFFDERNQLSHWFPRLESVDVPTIDTEILELEGGEGKALLEEKDIGLMEILMVEEPGVVLAFFGKPDFDVMREFVEHTENGQAFLRGDYKSATNLGNTGNYIEEPSDTSLAHTVMHQLQDRIMAKMPLFSALAIRERLDLDFHPDGRATLHPEVRFFISGGEVLYHFPRVDKETFARTPEGVEHYQRVINAINRDAEQLYEWAYRAAHEFDNASWSLDFVMDTGGNWVATDMALNGLYYSTDKERWHNLSEHEKGSAYNLEEQLGSAFSEPEIPDDGAGSR